MSIYDDYKNALVARRDAERRELAEIENEISGLFEALHDELGCPPEALTLLRSDGELAHPFDFAPDENRETSFIIELKVRDGDEVLDTINIPVTGVPAMGSSKRLIKVSRKEVHGVTDSFNSSPVVDAIKAILYKKIS
ncbi:hypothetical protein [Burkholderia sp. MSMB1072]|uniref:hypothetical protein n=1 Tax=Burkholderia sp. MSMB1072 TaxID=1637871 RepID=UPI000A9B2409|nr:hypothetical protein [Burkholderia sp. MSMB1072]